MRRSWGENTTSMHTHKHTPTQRGRVDYNLQKIQCSFKMEVFVVMAVMTVNMNKLSLSVIQDGHFNGLDSKNFP